MTLHFVIGSHRAGVGGKGWGYQASRTLSPGCCQIWSDTHLSKRIVCPRLPDICLVDVRRAQGVRT